MEALESYALDSESYQQLICYLDALTPFEAIRQAEEINKVNGFEVVGRVEVVRWSSFLKNQILKSELVFSDELDEKFRPTPLNIISKNMKCEVDKEDFAYERKVRLDYQKSYMKMLSF